ncbi:uncharacterized protein LY89DRAFT_675828 [Mollisia scopiformis]|uniref:Uncharacterized protein n=1 Tax=Mollisia scopiformis TaxID=149040 RepID=A0A132BB99_MOLSC|nr:uncharacterized protein LY89DRAFT_675828 [Mollisia scopiformis]KUJ09661.1 hypothetical protein LY89DRAFT_675828 [Mollisia scopiformis]
MADLSGYQLWMLQPNWTTEICQAAAPIFVNVTINGQDPRDLSIRGVASFLQLLPSPFNVSTEGDLCEWWTNTWTYDSEVNNTAFVNNIGMCCSSEVCSNVDWGGNPDIAGIGLMVVYYWLLGLTLFFAIALLIPFGRTLLQFAPTKPSSFTQQQTQDQTESSEEESGRSISERFFDAFVGTITPLFDLCLTFTITAEVSTLAFHSQAVSRYEMVISELLCSCGIGNGGSKVSEAKVLSAIDQGGRTPGIDYSHPVLCNYDMANPKTALKAICQRTGWRFEDPFTFALTANAKPANVPNIKIKSTKQVPFGSEHRPMPMITF